MSEKSSSYKDAQNNYNQMKREYSEAEYSYENSYRKMAEANKKLQDSTNDIQNNTSSGNTDSQVSERQKLLEKYENSTKPEAVIKDLNDAYNNVRKDAEEARIAYNKKEEDVQVAKKQYDEAVAKANKSGDAADEAEAKRLETIYKNKNADLTNAKLEYQELSSRELDTKILYFEKSIELEQGKQSFAKQEMQKYSNTIAELEFNSNAKRKEAENVYDMIIKLSALESLSDDQKVEIMQLRQKYEDLRVEYDNMRSDLEVVKYKYNDIKYSYDTSVKNIEKYEAELKDAQTR
jgi:chromosome segregation ATPase